MKNETIRIEAWMTRDKPDLMPWARYILEQIKKEETEKEGRRD